MGREASLKTDWGERRRGEEKRGRMLGLRQTSTDRAVWAVWEKIRSTSTIGFGMSKHNDSGVHEECGGEERREGGRAKPFHNPHAVVGWSSA